MLPGATNSVESPASAVPPGFEPAPPPPFAGASPPPRMLAQGAEGMLYKSYFISPSVPCAIKYRPAKKWRHPTLDARLTRHRILSEARILVKCRRDGISVPGVLSLDWDGSNLRPGGSDRDRLPSDTRQTEQKTVAAEGSANVKDSGGIVTETKATRLGGWMITEWIDGLTVRRSLDAWLPKHRNVKLEPNQEQTVSPQRPQEVKELMRRIGSEIGRMHQIGVIHGDLTTSNLMLRRAPAASPTMVAAGSGGHERTSTKPGEAGDVLEAEVREESVGRQQQEGGDEQQQQQQQQQQRPPLDGDVVLIDFGLATQSSQDEDRAVDLYVLERAFGSTHPNTEDLFDELLAAYGTTFKAAKVALKRLEDVRLRGRKKSMIG